MSVTASTAKVQYTLVSASGALAVPFYFLDNTHVRVIRTRANVETVLTTGFILSGVGVPAGGTLTLDGTQTAIADRVTIKRNVPLTQLSTYVTNDRFPAATMERNLDVLTMLVQQASEKADRALAFGEGETFSPALSVVARASKVLGFSSTGAIEFTDSATFSAPAEAAAANAAISESAAYASELSAAASATLASNQASAAAGSAVSAAASAAFASTFLPTQTGNSGKLLSTNGTTASWVSAVTGEITFGGGLKAFNDSGGYQFIAGQNTLGDRVGISGQAAGLGVGIVFFDISQTVYRPGVFDGSVLTFRTSGVDRASITSTGLAVTGFLSATADVTVSGATALAYRLTRGTVQSVWQNGSDRTFFGAASAHNTEILVNNTTVGAFSSTGLAVTGSLTTSSTTLHTSSVSLTNGAAAAAGTITNAPSVGNPTKWIPIVDNGVTRYIPAW